MFLKRLAYLCRYADMVPLFARPIRCMASNFIMNNIFENIGLKEFNQPWLSPFQLQRSTDANHEKGAPLNNCWGFIDGTLRPVSRPQGILNLSEI